MTHNEVVAALYEFYDCAKRNMGLPELTYTNIVSEARVACRDKIITEFNELGGAPKTPKEQALFVFYDKLSSALLEPDATFLELSLLIREAVKKTALVLGESLETPPYELSKISVKPGDVLVIKFKETFSFEFAKEVKKGFEELLPGNKVAITCGEIDFFVIECAYDPRDFKPVSKDANAAQS